MIQIDEYIFISKSKGYLHEFQLNDSSILLKASFLGPGKFMNRKIKIIGRW